MVKEFYVTIVTTITLAMLTQVQYVTACPAPCQCLELEYTITRVTCADQSLTSIPVGIPDRVAYLDLHGNLISSLTTVFQNFNTVQVVNLSFNNLMSLQEADFADVWNLRQLNLQSNNIKNIEEKTFNSLEELTVLNLANNSIKTINSATFFGLSNLETLDLHRNVISNLSNEAFLFLNALTFLDLSYNAISELSCGIFHDLFNLRTLKLDHNAIQVLDGQFFPELNTLQHLDVSHNELLQIHNFTLTQLSTLDIGWNNLTNLSAEYFENLANLTSLNLDGNPIASIELPVFEEMKSLQNLSLSSISNLKYLSRVSFEGLENLTSLFLNHNPQLSFIHKELFAPLFSISIIDLSFNNISSFYNESIQSNTQLTALDLRANVLTCDCGIEWLIESIQDNNNSIIQHVEQLDCVMPYSQKTVSLLNANVESLHCSEVQIVNHTGNSAFGIGQAAILTCEAESFPSPEITWITPRKRVLKYHRFHNYATLDYLPVRDEQMLLAIHESHKQDSYYTESESRADRIVVLADGSLYIDFVMRSDAGPYKCVAKNPRNSTEIVINVTLDFLVLNVVYLWSFVVGFGCAGSFFLLNLTYSLTLAAVRRCISVRRRERIREVIESMEQYKTAHLVSIKENYNNQVGRIRDQYHFQLGRLREHHQNQVSRMGRMKEGASQKVDKIRENYNNQISRLKEYSSNQLLQIREKYNNQVDKIKDYGTDKFDKLHEKYKWKQQHVIKIIETMNLDNCRTVFNSECVRTESMILESDLFITDVPLHSPIDSVSVSDSEYLTATSSESSRYTSHENLNLSTNATAAKGDDESLYSVNDYLPNVVNNPLYSGSDNLDFVECSTSAGLEEETRNSDKSSRHNKSKMKQRHKRNKGYMAQSQLSDKLSNIQPFPQDCDNKDSDSINFQLDVPDSVQPDIPGSVHHSDNSLHQSADGETQATQNRLHTAAVTLQQGTVETDNERNVVINMSILEHTSDNIRESTV